MNARKEKLSSGQRLLQIAAFIIGFCLGAPGGLLLVAYFWDRGDVPMLGRGIWLGGILIGFVFAKLTGHFLRKRQRNLNRKSK